MVVKRLMPLFEQYAPKEITEAMRGQFEALNSLVSEGVRQGEDEWIQKGISPEKPLADQEQPLLDQIDHAKTSNQRDELYFKLVPDFDIQGIFGEVANDDYERAVQLARGFQDAASRANATIAIARFVLDPKNAPTKPEKVAATPN